MEGQQPEEPPDDTVESSPESNQTWSSPDSNHTASSPRLEERGGLCGCHDGRGSHGCRVEAEAGSQRCSECEEVDEFRRCKCDCDECEEANAKITMATEGYEAAAGRQTDARSWQELEEEEISALAELGRETRSEVEATDGMDGEDSKEAESMMRKRRKEEVEVPGNGDGAFSAVAVMTAGIPEAQDELRRQTLESMISRGKISRRAERSSWREEAQVLQMAR